MRTYLCLALSLALAACGSDPIQHSEPVGIELKVKSSDVVQGAIADEKEINTETSNPYAMFISDARAALNGKDPSSIDVSSVTLLLGAGSTGVTTLGQIFNGTVDVQFQMNTSNDTFPVASTTIDGSTGVGPITLDTAFDPSAVGASNYAEMLTGSFKVSLRGPSAASFAGANAEANVQATITFDAYQ